MKFRIREYFRRLHRNDCGAMSVEKILILALIALPIIIILVAFKGTIVGWFTGQQNTLEQDAGNPSGG
jgi:Flp pilus assembly pilin Flp